MNTAVWSTRWTFATLGAIYGTWAVRIPDIAHRAGVGDGELGIALLTLAAGSLVGMPLAGRGLRAMRMPTLVRGLTLASPPSRLCSPRRRRCRHCWWQPHCSAS